MKNDIFAWMKSTRSVAVIIILAGVTVGLFLAKITSENYMQIALIVITAYFAKRDSVSEQGGTSTSEITTTSTTP